MKKYFYLSILLFIKSFCIKAQELKQEEFKSPSHNVSIRKKVLVPTQTVVTAPTVAKGKREALLIGNTDYKYGLKLGDNPINDANDLGNTLRKLGFNVKIITNADLATIKQSVRDFELRIKGAEMATFFFAGHGIETGGKKFIIPVDAQLKTPTDTEDDAYKIETLFQRLKRAGAKHNLIILDACRNDPFREEDPNIPETERAWGNEKDRGFTPIELEKMTEGNIYLAMATGWGRKAQNGTGKNGVYSASLLNELKAGERLERVFDKAGINVKTKTSNRQNPQFVKEVSIDDEFFF